MTDPTLTRLRLLEDALRAIGINPDADPPVTAKRWTVERDADRRGPWTGDWQQRLPEVDPQGGVGAIS